MNKKIIKRIYNVVIILCFIGAIGWCFSHFIMVATWFIPMMPR
jgi:hypothetical protein